MINFEGRPSKKTFEKEQKEALAGLDNPGLTIREKRILKKAFCEKNSTYQEIGDEESLSCTRTRGISRGALLKIQIANGALDDKTKKFIDDFSKTFDVEPQKTQEIIINNPELIPYPIKKMKENIEGVAERFENEGLTVEDYLQAALNKPPLFYQSPDTVEKNIRGLVDKFSDVGLTVEDYLAKAALRHPSLFCQSPDTIEKNIRNLVGRFSDEGLTVEDYLAKAALRQPSLFYQSPDTISEHIDILKFSRINTEADINKDNFFEKIFIRPLDLANSSSLLLIKYLIIPKMFEGNEIPKELKRNKLREKLNNYLKENPNSHFTFSIEPIEVKSDCFKILDETLRKIEEDAGVNNIFEVKEIK